MATEILTTITQEPYQVPVIPRPKPMKVLVLGLSRTGTMSMWKAFQILGLKSYHFLEVGRNWNNNHIPLWTKAMKAKYHGIGKPFEGSDFDQMLWSYDAISDAPAVLFADELLAAYPDAKVILTIRSRESWMKSMTRTFLEILSWRSWVVLGWFDPKVSGAYFPLLEMCPRVWSNNLPPWEESAQPALMQYFDEHNDHIRKVVPSERLLEFHPSQGWGPLCEFLDLPLPKEKQEDSPETTPSFPHVNDGTDVVKFHAIFYWMRWLDVLKRGVLWSGGIGLAYVVGNMYLRRK